MIFLNLLFSEQQGWLLLGLFLSRQRQNAEELEFYVAYGGPVEIQLGNVMIRVEEGDGAFINSNVLHSFRQIEECECKCPNIVFSHTLITAPDTRSYSVYVQPIMMDNELPYLILHQNCPWHKEILDLLDRVFSLLQKYSPCSDFYGEFPMLPFENESIESSCFEMEIQCLLNRIWQIIYTNKNNIPRVPDSKTRHLLEIRTQMLRISARARLPVASMPICRNLP